MILNKTEFILMNNPLRELIQESYEIPILRRMATTNESFHNALEIGCGNGNGTRLIKKHFNPAKIEAIDLDERMIRIAQKRTGDGSINFSVMAAAKLEYPDDSEEPNGKSTISWVFQSVGKIACFFAKNQL